MRAIGLLAVMSVGLSLSFAVGCGARMTTEERFVRAASEGRSFAVRDQVEEGTPVNSVAGVQARTALHAAAANGHDALVQYLLSAGANVNAQDAAGDTALHLAMAGGHDQCIQKIMYRSPDLTLRNKAGKTATEVPTASKLTQPDIPARHSW